MTYTNISNEIRIRGVVKCFASFMILMLFQTSFLNLGTITAFITLLITILSFFSTRKNEDVFSMNVAKMMLLYFLLITVPVTVIFGYLPSYKYISQIILCFLLFSIKLSSSEQKYIKKVFIGSSAFYAVLTIYSCYMFRESRYLHGNIELFGASLDPNFIGIPLVAAMSLLLYDFLYTKKKFLSVILYITIAISVIYTASRGNFLTVTVISTVIFLTYLFRMKTTLWKKLLTICIIVITAIVLFKFVSDNFAGQWERVSSIAPANDNGRFDIWRHSLELFMESPIFGSGLSSNFHIYGKAAHNTYIEVLSETGFIGAILLATFLANMIVRSFKNDKAIFFMFLGVLLQISFLDTLNNRCLWVILCWIAMLPPKEEIKYEQNRKIHV